MKIKTPDQISLEIRSFLDTAKNPLLVVVGPTASGKTKLAVHLAKQFNGEIINADSRQIYEEMKIGNELTKPEEMEGIQHHLLGCYPISSNISIAEYKRDAEAVIGDVLKRGKLPILCGGSVMWIDAVVDNYVIPEGNPDWKLRAELEKKGIDELLEELDRIDQESAEHLRGERNKRYIIRALEIYSQTGRKKSEIMKKGIRKYEIFKLAPYRDRKDIYKRINERTAYQVDHGMIPEVQALVNKYSKGDPRKLLELGWPGITSIGCKEVIPYLLNEITKEELISTLQQHNRNYAKRQLTWLRKDQEVNWIQRI